MMLFFKFREAQKRNRMVKSALPVRYSAERSHAAQIKPGKIFIRHRPAKQTVQNAPRERSAMA